MNAMPPALTFLLLTFAGWVNRRQQKVIDYLLEENRVLREQLGGRRLRLTDTQRRRLAAKGRLLGRKLLSKVAGIVTPDTILRWYRQLIAQKYDSSGQRGPGRPRTTEDIEQLVIIMANDNPSWGYTKIRGALRNLTDDVDGFLRNKRYLILDNDPLFTEAFEKLLGDSGVTFVKLPAKSPNLNAFAERFVLSIKSECLNKMVILGERHLRAAVQDFLDHYHAERNHQGLDNELIAPATDELDNEGPVRCRERQGGVLKYYYRDAA